MEILKFIHKIKSFAETTPNKVMIVDKNAIRKTTYSEFWTLSQKIASLIKKRLGESQRQFILIYLPDSMDYFAADTAIWMTGNAAVHVGASFPKKRIDFIVNQTEAPLIIDADFIRESIQCKPCAEIAPRTSDMPCALFFTSGSEGNPKGILHSDAGFLLNFRRYTEEYGIREYRSFLTIAPSYFIAVVVNFEALENGLELHLLPVEMRMNVAELQDYIANHHIESVFLSPSLLQVYRNKAQSLKLVFTGSERLVGCYSDEYILLNGYGQTETAALCICKKIDKNYDNSPIGKPLKGLEVCLLDNNGNEVPDGEVGELCLKSGFIAPVYFKDPERTAELTKGGVQHTGDLMKRLPNGDLLYVQRKDWMVKINGQRVEPGEIEKAMKHIGGIANAVVKGFTTDDLSRQYLVGYYIVTSDAENVNDDYIIAELKKTLPAYMVPQYMVKMDKFPLNANLKIDRKSLKSPKISPRQTEYVAAEDELQKALCNLFSRIMKIDQIGIDDDFMILGGDSIRSMKLQQMFNSEYADKKWGVLSTSMINNGRTPRKIAEMLANDQNLDFVEQEDYPLYCSQMRYALLTLENPDKPIGILPKVYRLDDDIDMKRMARSIEIVSTKHKAFGIRIFRNEKGELRQKFSPTAVSINIESLDEMQLQKAIAEIRKPMLSLNNPLFRLRLIETSNGKYLLTMFHHTIFDGASQTVFKRDVSLAYSGQPIPQEIWSPFHVAFAEQQFRNSKQHAVALQWFHDKWDNAPEFLYPIPDKQEAKTNGNTLFITLNVTPAEIKKAAQAMGCTLNIYASAIFARLLGKYTGNKKDVAIQMPYATRGDFRTENTIGMLASGFVLHTCWDNGKSLQTQINEINDDVVTAMSYTYADKESFMPDVMLFLYQGEKEEWLLDGKEALPLEFDDIQYAESMPMVVHLSINKTSANADGIVRVMVQYYPNLYSENYIHHMMDEFSEMLKSTK